MCQCSSSRPEHVSQAFEMITRERKLVPPGRREVVSGSCSFQKDVLVSRLSRRTRLITDFSVRRGDGRELWRDAYDFTLDLDPPEAFAADEPIHWECTYENVGDLTIEIGGSLTDNCSLLGTYELPDGSVDPFPEHCAR